MTSLLESAFIMARLLLFLFQWSHILLKESIAQHVDRRKMSFGNLPWIEMILCEIIGWSAMHFLPRRIASDQSLRYRRLLPMWLPSEWNRCCKIVLCKIIGRSVMHFVPQIIAIGLSLTKALSLWRYRQLLAMWLLCGWNQNYKKCIRSRCSQSFTKLIEWDLE